MQQVFLPRRGLGWLALCLLVGPTRGSQTYAYNYEPPSLPPSPPEVPPSPQSPPSAPSPAQPPGVICLDTCQYANNGVCNDRAHPQYRQDQADSISSPPAAGRRLWQDDLRPPSASGPQLSEAYAYSDSAGDDYARPSSASDRRLSESSSTSYDTANYGACATGTDCTDCSQRDLCTSCPSACYARGIRLGPAAYCLESMFNDNICDDNCNVWECTHDGASLTSSGCSTSAAQSECLSATTARANAALVTKPANTTLLPYVYGSNASARLVPVEIRMLAMNPLTIKLNEDDNTFNVAVEFTLQLRWQDARFFDNPIGLTHPCSLQLPQMITASALDAQTLRVTKEAYKAHMWFPNTLLQDKALDYSQDAVSRLTTVKSATLSTLSGAAFGNTSAAAWQGGHAPPQFNGSAGHASSVCYDCVSYEMRVATTIEPIVAPYFKWYPFDYQDIGFTFSVADANLFSCDQLFAQLNYTNDILPRTGEWQGHGITLENPLLADGSRDLSSCRVNIRARRNYLIFVIKQVIPSVIVVYSGLCSLFLSADDHTGDRAGTILAAALILMFNFQQDLKLGSVSYLIWWDWLNVVSMVVLLLSLVASLYEHSLVKAMRDAEALALNRTTRVVFIVLLYPIILFALLLNGFGGDDMEAVGWSLIFLGGVVCVFVGHRLYHYRMRSIEEARRRAVDKLKAAERDDPRFAELLLAAFNAYDADGSSLLSIDEVRHLLKAMFHNAPSSEFGNIMLEVRKFANADDELNLDSFSDALDHLGTSLAMPTKDDTRSKGSKAEKRGSTTKFVLRGDGTAAPGVADVMTC